jgi:hypothetical protein
MTDTPPLGLEKLRSRKCNANTKLELEFGCSENNEKAAYLAVKMGVRRQ